MTFGEGTTDEMFFVFFDYVLYEEGDEQIALGPNDPSCQEDLNGDGLVSVNDILMLLSDFGCLANCEADVDLDDAVSISDLLTILSVFGGGC